MEECTPRELTEAALKELVSHAKDRLYCHGVLFGASDDGRVSHAPVTLFPSPIPRGCFMQVLRVQTDYNLLMHRVAHDYNFLKEALQYTIQVDDFTKRLWDIYETVRKEGIAQPVSLAMNRSDYLMNREETPDGATTRYKPKQVEFNTIASGLGGLCRQLSHCHSYTLRQAGMANKIPQIPQNTAMDGLAEAVVVAWQQYANPKAVVLFLVSTPENNVYDQRYLEYAILEQSDQVRVVRRTFPDLRAARLTEDKRFLIDDLEVAVIYQRIGYSPSQFENEKDWEVRLQIERSRIICCPSINYHLAGTKKVQQVLAMPGILERFLPDDPDAVTRIRDTFTGLYSLDMGEEGDKAVAMAMETPEKFVLKPQREGGGNNLFGEDLCRRMAEIGQSRERTEYILMEKIRPDVTRNYVLRCGAETRLCNLVSEIGIFGTLVGTEDTILLNKETGLILKSKQAGADEGGVALGFGVVDSPILV